MQAKKTATLWKTVNLPHLHSVAVQCACVRSTASTPYQIEATKSVRFNEYLNGQKDAH